MTDWGTTSSPTTGAYVSTDASETGDGVSVGSANDINRLWAGMSMSATSGATGSSPTKPIENFYFRIDTNKTVASGNSLNQKYNVQLDLGVAADGKADHLLQIFANGDGDSEEVELVLYQYSTPYPDIGAVTTGSLNDKVTTKASFGGFSGVKGDTNAGGKIGSYDDGGTSKWGVEVNIGVVWFSSTYGGAIKADASGASALVTSVFSSSGGLGGVGATKDVLRSTTGEIILTTTSTVSGTTLFVDLNISKLAITVATQDQLSANRNVESGTTIGLSSSSGNSTFSTTSGGTYTSTLNVTIFNGSSSITFFYKDTTRGTPTITAAKSPSVDYTDATQKQTITASAISKFTFTTSAHSVTKDTATPAITIQTQDSFGNAKNAGSNITVNLTSDAGTGKFDTSSGGAFDGSITLITISSGSSTGTFYYKDSAEGTPTITVDENPSAGYTAATQKQTISALSVAITYSLSRAVKDADTLTVTATFSSDLTTIPQIAVDTQGTDLSATNMSGANKVWTYAYDVPSGSDGTATISLSNAQNAGGDNAATPTNRTFTIDNTVPTVALTYNPNRAVKNSDTLTIQQHSMQPSVARPRLL